MRRAVRTFAWSGLVLLALATLLGCFGRHHWVLNLFDHFRLQYAVLALALAPAGLLLPRLRLVHLTGALVLLGVNASILLPYFTAECAEAPEDAPSASVLLWNTWRGNTDGEEVAAVVEEAQADVVVLLETTAPVREMMAGLSGPYRVAKAGDGVILIRRGLAGEVRDGVIDLRLDGRAVQILAVHLPPPVSGSCTALRAARLRQIGAWSAGLHSPCLILGDFNATPWSFELRDFVERTGLRDSSVGRGYQATWPFHNALTSLFAIPIDHCFASPEVVVLERRVGLARGSNHRPLLLRFALVE